MTTAQLKILLSPEVQAYIRAYSNRDLFDLILSAEKFEGLSNALIADQIKGHRKAAEKIPLWYETAGLVYPPGKGLEQCSSQAMASFKASLFDGGTMVDLTGGAGVDSFLLGKKFKEAHYVESDHALFQITKHNLETLGAKNFHFHNQKAEEFLNENPKTFDLIYIDPDRRPGGKGKKFLLQDTTPNVIALIVQLKKYGKKIAIKASPMLDIKEGLDLLGGAETVVVLGTPKECKELVFIIGPNQNSLNPLVRAITIPKQDQVISFQFYPEEEANKDYKITSPQNFIYDPYPAVLKSGGFKSLAHEFDMGKLHPNTHLYTSNNLVSEFPGRAFELLDIIPVNKKAIKEKIPDGKAHLIVRNYPRMAEELTKKLGLTPIGNRFLIAATLADGKKAGLLCQSY